MDYDQAPRWGAAPEDEGDEYVESGKQKPRTTFLQRWMMREAPAPETEEKREGDTEETPEGRKKKRFRSLFKRLFPSIASAEKPEAEGSPRKGLFAELIPNKAENSEPTEADPKKLEEHKEQNSEVQSQEFQAPEKQDSIGTSLEAAPATEQKDALVVEREPNNEAPLAPAEQVDELPPAPEVPPPIFTPLAPRRNYDPVVAALDRPALHNPLDRPPEVQVSQVENSKNGGALTAFLAADFLSRRRDRKIRRELKKLNKEVIEKSDQKPKTAPASEHPRPAKQPESLKTQVAPEARQAEAKPERPEQQVLVAAVQLESAPQPRAESSPAEVSRKSAEVKPVSPVETVDTKKLKKEELRLQEALLSTDLFLRQREQQLDEMRQRSEAPPTEEREDRRKEKDFDRRHEILDESPKKVPSSVGFEVPTPTPLPSIGDILRERAAGPRKQQPMNQHVAPNGSTANPEPLSMYQQSVQYGVGSAVVILVLAAVAYLLNG